MSSTDDRPRLDAESVEQPVSDVDADAYVSSQDGESAATEASAEPVEVGEPPPWPERRGTLEAILLVTDEPVTAVTLAQVLGRPQPEVEGGLAELAAEYEDQERGFELRQIAGGWRLYTREVYADIVERFVLDGQQAKLTQAALETLAVVAYRQPVSRSRVSAIRGVNCDGVMKTLTARGLVVEAGTEAESGATLFRTTPYFLERLGLDSLEELPELAPHLPELDELDDIDDRSGGGGPSPLHSADQTDPAESSAPVAMESATESVEPDDAEESDDAEEPDDVQEQSPEPGIRPYATDHLVGGASSAYSEDDPNS